MSQITIKRPGMRTKSKSTEGNYFLNVELDGKPERVIMVAGSEVIKDWDNIQTLVIGKVHYSMGRDPQNATSEPSEDFAFDRAEVIDYQTKEYILGNKKFDLELAKLEKVMLAEVELSSKELESIVS